MTESVKQRQKYVVPTLVVFVRLLGPAEPVARSECAVTLHGASLAGGSERTTTMSAALTHFRHRSIDSVVS